jgi:aldehyde:ferredoxin oxidoreductase
MKNRVIRVDLTSKKVEYSELPEKISRQYIGGAGVGAYLLYNEVPPGVKWDDPENILIIGTGPLNGTVVAGSGSFCAVSKGPLTNGATSSQANGFFGAYLRLSGFETIVIKGISDEWVYLYIHNGTVEIRNARHLVGMDTYKTGEEIKKELLAASKKDLSVFSVGPAGENLVKFAAIVGDEGHVVAHNGQGAVMGKKRLKAFVAGKSGKIFNTPNDAILSDLNKQALERTKTERPGIYYKGTSFQVPSYVQKGLLPIKNLTTNLFSDYEKLDGEYYRSHFKLKPQPCWRCPLKHIHRMEVTEGPYKGYVGEEPEYELVAGWGSNIDNRDPGAVVMLSDTVDRLGFDSNEASWLISFVMECYEKNILNIHDTDGIEMTWGNVEAARAMLHKIARREGFGNILAEGVMRSAEKIGGEALNMAVYVKKGHAPRGHDHRARWIEMADTATSDQGTVAAGPQFVEDVWSPGALTDSLTQRRVRAFVDSTVVCAFPQNLTSTNKTDYLVAMVNAATGWELSEQDPNRITLRIDNVFRAFNVRHGLTPAVELPSPRWGSAQVDGPLMAKSIMPYWNEILDEYYKKMGWDRISGKPLPETLRNLDLDYIVDDLW